MTDKIDKNLARFSEKELDIVDDLLSKLNENNLQGLNLTQLKGHSDIFRIRKGKIRIIFQRHGKKILLHDISRRNDKTYKDY